MAFSALLPYALALLLVQQPGEPRPAPPEPAPAPTTLDKLPLPPGTVIVVVDDLNKAVNQAQVRKIVLTAEEHKALMDKIAQLEKQAQPKKGEALVGSCILTGRVTGDFLELRMELAFRTTVENTLVSIGFKDVRFTKATLDGEIPVWGPPADGYTIQVREPRLYQMELETQLRITRSGTDRSVTLDLPQAVFTTLKVTLGEKAQSAFVKDFGPIQIENPEASLSELSARSLGPLDRLVLTWQPVPEKTKTPDPRLSVTGDLRVRIDENVIETVARLKIEPHRGSFASLRFRLGPQQIPVSVLEVETEPRSDRIDYAYAETTRILTINFKEPLTPADGSLVLRIRMQQGQPGKPGDMVSLGQVSLLDGTGSTQRGTLAVWVAPDVTLPAFYPKDLSQLEPGTELRLDPPATRTPDVAYRYWQQPWKLEAELAPVQPVKPSVEVRAVYQLHLKESASWTESGLLLTADLEIVRLSRSGVQELEISWPKDWKLDQAFLAGQPIATPEVDAARSVVVIALGNRQQTPLKIRLEGYLPIKAGAETALVLPAPTQAYRKKEPLPVVFRDGELRLTAPDDKDLWLQNGTSGLLAVDGRLPDLDVPLRGTTSFSLTPEKPRQLTVSWHPRQYEVDTSIGVYLTPKEMQVRQILSYEYPSPSAGPLRLRIPREMESWPVVHGEGRLDPQTIAVSIDGPVDSLQRIDAQTVEITPRKRRNGWCAVTVAYRKSVSNQAPLAVLLCSPVNARVRKAEARLWAGARYQLQAEADSGWVPTRLAAVAGADVAPALELRGTKPEAPLLVRLQEAPPSPLADVVADRVLIEVRVLGQGRLEYRVRCWLSRIRSDHLQMVLSKDARAVLLQDVKMSPGGRGDQPLPEEASLKPSDLAGETGNDGQTTLRIPVEPQFLLGPAVLELRYQLEVSAEKWFVTTLPAPELAGRAVVGQVRWRVELPARSGLLSRDLPLLHSPEAVAEQDWQIGWLFPPREGYRAAEMERWFTQNPEEASSSNSDEERAAFSFTALGSPPRLQIVYVPELAWLLVCSLLVLVVGVAPYGLPPRWALAGLALLVAGFIILVGWLPGLLLPLLFGAQPGLAVLAVVLGVLWLRRRRWRQQIVLMPGFARLKVGSSLLRSSAVRPTVEPSTVDVPKPPGPTSSELRA